MRYKVSVIIEKDKHGYYAYCPELEGCQSEALTIEEALANIREAVQLYVSDLSPEERESLLTEEVLSTSVEVNVA